MKRSILLFAVSVFFGALAVSNSDAMASSGTASWDITGVQAGFDVELSEDRTELTGSMTGFGGSFGRVDLRRNDGGLWEGQFGNHRITVRNVSYKSKNGKIVGRYTLNVLPSGFFTLNSELTENGDFDLWGNHSAGRVHLDIHGGVEEDDFFGGNQYQYYSLEREGNRYSGFSSVQWRSRLPRNYHTELKFTGDLDPVSLSSEDPQLYMILYVLPYSLHK